MMAWEIWISIAAVLLVNLLIWVFLFGKTIGRLSNRMCKIENDQQKEPQIMPECYEIFSELREGVASLNAKVDILLDSTGISRRKRIQK